MIVCLLFPLAVLVTISYVTAVPVTRGLNGDQADIQDAPFVVTILYKDQVRGIGSIISPRHILTDRFGPIYDLPYQVRVGSNSSIKGGQVYDVKKKFTQPDYGELLPFHPLSLGILELASDIEFNDSVQPINFAGADDPEIEDGVMMTVYGFDGFDHLLRELDQPKYNLEKCRASFVVPDLITETVICAGSETERAGHEYADNGTPLVYNGVQVGVQGTVKRDIVSTLSAYESVSAASNWIRGVIDQPK